MQTPIQITIGGAGANDPVAGATEYHNALLIGDNGWLIKSGYGPLPFDSYERLATGGFKLVGDAVIAPQYIGTEDAYTGNVFRPGEIYFWQPSGLRYGTNAGTYTNGFDLTRVIAQLFGRIGWQQPEQSGSPVVNANNLLSKSGRYFQDFHTLCTVANVKATMEEAAASDVNLNSHLESLQKAAIMRCFNGVFREREYLEQSLVYDRMRYTIAQPILNAGLFVGYEINIAQAMNIAVQIDSLRLLFDGDVDLPLYLYCEGKATPVWADTVSVTGNEATVVDIDSLVLSYIGSATKGSRFYMGYYQADLGSVKALHEEACFNQTFAYCARPFESKDGRVTISTTNRTYGMNLEVSSFKDHTQQIVKKPFLFDEAIGLMVAYSVLEQIIYATQSNATERILKDQLDKVGIQLDMNGAAPISESPRIRGLAQRIDEEMKRLRSSFYPKPKAQVVNYAHC